MPAPPPHSPQESLSGPPLWTLTAVLVLVSGLLFYFAQVPLAQAFDALEPDPVVEAAPPVEETAALTPQPDPTPPPPPDPWTRAEIDAALVETAAGVGGLVENARAELPTYEDLGSPEEAQAQRAANRFSRWGEVWRNRVDVYRTTLPPVELCVPVDPLPEAEPVDGAPVGEEPTAESRELTGDEEEGEEESPIIPLTTEEACREMHGVLTDLVAIAEARTYEGSQRLLAVAVERSEDPRLLASLSAEEVADAEDSSS